MEMIWVWLAVVAVSLIVEFFTWDLTSIWFAIAGLISLILSAIDGVNWIWQLSVFIVLSAILIIFVRQICRKFLLKSTETTNIDSYIGKKAKLLTPIKASECGTVKFNGVIWSAVTVDNTELAKDEQIEIVKIDGNKLVVKKVEKETKKDKTKDSKNDNKSEEVVEQQNDNVDTKETLNQDDNSTQVDATKNEENKDEENK